MKIEWDEGLKVNGILYKALKSDGVTGETYIIEDIVFSYIYGKGWCSQSLKEYKSPQNWCNWIKIEFAKKEEIKEEKEEIKEFNNMKDVWKPAINNNQIIKVNGILYKANVSWKTIDDIDYGMMDKRFVSFKEIDLLNNN